MGCRLKKSELEELFFETWLRLFPNLPVPDRQIKPVPGRQFRLDFAWEYPGIRLGVEVDGGSYMGKSGHNTAAGQARDYEKGNLCVQNSWRILRFNTPMLKNIEDCVTFAAEILTGAK